MVKVTNNTAISQPFHVNGGKAGEPKFTDIRPGETAEVDLADRKGAQITSREAVQAITVHDKPGREAAKAAEPAAHKA